MRIRAAFGLAIVLASVSGSLAAQRGHVIVDTQTVYNPSGCSIWGFPCNEVWPYKRQ
jgi:hypothetical protein